MLLSFFENFFCVLIVKMLNGCARFYGFGVSIKTQILRL